MADSSSHTHGAPEIPDPDQRLPIVLVSNPHPAILHPDRLLESCGLRTQRRSGPGGQHRNKTSSGAFLHYPPTNTTAEATERRSQADNRKVALERLRFRLAVEVRSPSPIDGHELSSEEHKLRKQYQGQSLKISDRNSDKPAVLALLLNDLHACGGQPSAVGPAWLTSTSALVRLIKSYPSAFVFLNQIRQHHNRPPLR